MGSCLFLRRSKNGHSLLVALLRSLQISKISSDCLSQLLRVHNVNMRKTATKLCKIRALCNIETVMKDLTTEEVTAVEAMLKEMESKKKKNY